MDDRRKNSRRDELARNLERFRSSGRVPAVRASSGKLNPVRRSSGQLDPVPGQPGKSPKSGMGKQGEARPSGTGNVRRSSGQIRAVADSSLFNAIVPHADPELAALRAEVLGLRRLQEAIHFLGGAADPFALRTEILELGCSLSGLTRGFLALPTSSDNGKRRFKVKESRGLDKLKGTPEYKVLRGILNRTLERREALLEGSILDGGILDHAESNARTLSLGAVVCLPLEADGELFGALLLDDPKRSETFLPPEESLLRSFARHAALAIARQWATGQAKRKLARITQRGERLEGERERLEAELQKSQRRGGGLTRGSERVRKDERAGREYRRLLEDPYAEAKQTFARRYLRELLRRNEGDLDRASDESGLSMERLVRLLETLKVEPVEPVEPVEGRRSARSPSASEAGG